MVFDAHNAVWTITERMEQNAAFYLKLPLAFETSRIKKYEGMIVKDFDATLAVTEPDRLSLLDALHQYGNDGDIPIAVIPIAVDTQQIRPVQRAEASLNIITMGTLYYPPNADGIRWFIQQVFPLVRQKLPGVKFNNHREKSPKRFPQACCRQGKWHYYNRVRAGTGPLFCRVGHYRCSRPQRAVECGFAS